MTACEETDPGDDKVPKTLVITGINKEEGNITVGVAYNDPKKKTGSGKNSFDIIAVNKVSYPTNAEKSVTIPLLSTTTNAQFTGTGNFYIILIFEGPTTADSDDANYSYAGAEGGLVTSTYNLTQATSTIPFTHFFKL